MKRQRLSAVGSFGAWIAKPKASHGTLSARPTATDASSPLENLRLVLMARARAASGAHRTDEARIQYAEGANLGASELTRRPAPP